MYGPSLPRYTVSVRPPAAAIALLQTRPLHLAAKSGRIERVNEALSQTRDADLQALDDKGHAALHLAAMYGHANIVRALLARGAAVDAPSGDEYQYTERTALFIAACNGHVEVARILIDASADLEARPPGNATTLQRVVSKGHVELVRLLLQRGASVMVRAEDSWTALHVAAQCPDSNGAMEIMQLVLEHGAQVAAVDADGRSALHFAAQVGAVRAVGLLLERGAPVDARDSSGYTALHTAAALGHIEIVRVLIERGADGETVDNDGWTALHAAARMGYVDVLRLLLDRGGDVAARARDGSTPLHAAAGSCETECVRVLLERGADPDAFSKAQETPLHCALSSVGNSSASTLRALLAAGADVNLRDSAGRTAMQLARNRPVADYAEMLRFSQLGDGSAMLDRASYTRLEEDTGWVKLAETDFRDARLHEQRFNQSGSLDDVSDAIAAFERANAYDPDGVLGSEELSELYMRRYSLTENMQDLDSSIDHIRVRCSNTYSPKDRELLAYRLRYRYCVAQASVDLIEAMDIFGTAMASAKSVHDRFKAAHYYAEMCYEYRGAAAALKPYRVAINAIPGIVELSDDLGFRYSSIILIRQVVSMAIAVAIEAEHFQLAVEWYDRSRCLVWGQILHLRSSIHALRNAVPDFAKENEHIIGPVGLAEDGHELSLQNPGRMQAIMRYGKLMDDFGKVVEQAKKLPGLESLALAKTLQELREAAALGPIVIVHVSDARSDALILQHGQDEVQHIALPRLTTERAQAILAKFQHCLHFADIRTRGSWTRTSGVGSMEHILHTLWVHAVEPVLQALGLIVEAKPELQQLIRITWCVSGPLSFLPLHAAGIYSQRHARPQKAYEYAVHSYTPSLSALLEAHRLSTANCDRTAEPVICAVSQPNTPGQSPLPGTIGEVEAIREAVGEQNLVWLNGAAATSASVLSLMEQHAWVHLACHAVQDAQNPLQSAFMLHDGSLTLHTIMRRAFGGKSLAVLSACQTATGDEDLPEEVVHLAAGMLTAGFQSVVATIWSIGDGDAPVVMKEFYSYLMREAKGDSTRSAHALHGAIQRLRDKVGEESFMQWVPFIHLGV